MKDGRGVLVEVDVKRWKEEARVKDGLACETGKQEKNMKKSRRGRKVV